MSDVQMDTPESSAYGNTRTRAAKPELYHGDRAKLETWILQFDRYFHLEGDRIEDSDKVVLATTYMRGDAEKWANPFVRKYMDDTITDSENTTLMEDWTEFKKKLRQIFSPIKESLIAKQKIQTLQQTKSTADYTTIFQRYAELLNWDNDALMEMYKQGLKPTVRKALMMSGAAVTTLDELIDEAIRLDNDLHELALEEEIYASRSRINRKEPRNVKTHGYQQNRPNQGQKRFNKPNRGFYRSNGLEDMQLDTIHQGKPKKEYGNNQKFDKPKETRKCYNCDKVGHLSRDCRMKNKVVRQLNFLSHSNNDDYEEEWDVDVPTHVDPAYHPELNGYDQVLIDADPSEEESSESSDEDDTYLERSRAPTPSEEEVKKDTFDAEQRIMEIRALRLYYSTQSERAQQAMETILHARYLSLNTVELANVVKEIDQLALKIESPASESSDDRATTSSPEISDNEENPLETLGALQLYHPGQEGIAERTATPHPGNRVKGHWDHESKDDEYPEERALTPEELAIHTPLASPKLVRQNATLWEDNSVPPKGKGRKQRPNAFANDGQAMVINSLEEDWVATALREQAPKGPIPAQIPRTDKYLEDIRNPQHGTLSWLACYNDSCTIHYSSKEAQSYFPSNRRRCRWQYFDCPKNTCADHLYDKRVGGYFPDYAENGDHWLDKEGCCRHLTWQCCLRADCIKHYLEKKANGYGPSEDFLGTCLAPGIDPEAATLPMPPTSSNSQ
jgi:hypothetical protein